MNRRKKIILSLSITGGVLVSFSAIALFNLNTTNLIIQNAFSPTHGFSKDKFDGETFLGVQYSTNSKSNTLDLYIPKDVEDPKLMVLIHGGGFAYNDSQSRQARFMYEYFRNHGYAVSSLNYRLSGEALFPASLSDVKSALRFLSVNGEKYGYNAENISLWGESAGGYLAAMATLTPNDEYRDVMFVGEELYTTPVNYHISNLLDYYGLSDIESVANDFKELKVPDWLLSIVGSKGRLEDEDSDLAKYFNYPLQNKNEGEPLMLSPINRIDTGTPKDLRVFITHGSVDITVPCLQSKSLADKFSSFIGEDNVEFVLEKNYKHADDRFYTAKNLEKVANWLSLNYK